MSVMPRFDRYIQKADALRVLEQGGTLRYDFYRRLAEIENVVGNKRFVSYATYHALVSGDYNLRLDQRIDSGLTLILEWKMRQTIKAVNNG